MSRTCPQCGNLNNDQIKFCTACGNALATTPGESGLRQTLPAGPAAAAPKPDPGSRSKVLIAAGIAIIVIVGALAILQGTGTFRVFPSTVPQVTSPVTLTPEMTPLVKADTTVPAIIPAENLTAVATVPDLPGTSPTPTKAVLCPSDRRACGANCTNLLTDRDNCGACGVSCSAGRICQAGRCLKECSFGESSCFDGCYNLSFDAQNCGACGNTCPFGLVCNRSVCSPTVTTVVPTYLG